MICSKQSLLPIVGILLGGSIFPTNTIVVHGFVSNELPNAISVSPFQTNNASIPRPTNAILRQQPVTVTLETLYRNTRTTLSATPPGTEKSKKSQGVYVRPSGAIERGSGFFVPGLEGPKVRLVIGMVLLIATGVNHVFLGTSSSTNVSFSEAIAILYSILLLFQFAIESAKEALLASPMVDTNKKEFSPTPGSPTEVLEQNWSASATPEKAYRSKVQWAAASYLSMTPTTQILLLSDDDANKRNNENTTTSAPQISYRLGNENLAAITKNKDASTIQEGVQAALEEVRQSKGGRIALPMSHPAVQALLSSEDSKDLPSEDDKSNRLRTVILQKISDHECWMVSSDQLLAGYTSGDLKWLGQLGNYVATASEATIE